ncbi:unnamed protein product [Peronospora farinosa]|uniref:Uncharacterized protein n=1 Tax=Peronospora farinosa TaxID=134698 RepID=A0AAV0UMX5_9STRA|nr:unnamed protein product [Peronospora farinosa]CAI5736945.1 unnamed protein product [Peronospora farinosa]
MVHVERSQAVETYLHNFIDGKEQDQEILEITLCYGIQCLSRSVSLNGMNCHELRTITGYDAAKTRDFDVRNASQSIDKKDGRRPVEVRTKPSHAWRDGEVEMPDFSTPSSVAEVALQSSGDSETEKGALYSLPPSFDEIDYFTKLLGKALVNLTWKIFAERKGMQITTREELDEQFTRVDQRKTVTMIPPLQMPVTSFATFLSMYVTECVRQAQQTGSTDNNKSGSGQESIYAGRGARLDSSDLPSVKKGQQRSASSFHAVRSNTKPAEFVHDNTGQKQRPLLPQPRQRQSQQDSRSFHRVQSKIQPAILRTQQQKLTRVKKTQSQRKTEALARDGRLAHKKIPISDITTGAVALKIVDNFIKSPLMDKFGRGHMPVSGRTTPLATKPTQSRLAQKDPIEEELDGTTVLDNSSCGCKSELRHRSASQPKEPKRRYDGWVGDFGLLHTKTVRPEWNEDDAAEPDSRK